MKSPKKISRKRGEPSVIKDSFLEGKKSPAYSAKSPRLMDEDDDFEIELDDDLRSFEDFDDVDEEDY